jgi:MobA/MobL family
MAIFSLNHRTVGRTTHKAGTASAHAHYITRPEAATEVIGARMPTETSELAAWLDGQEQGDRKNARVIDKVMVALPLELDHDQRVQLVEDFAERLTEGRASWVAGIHDGPGDADNPHAHIIFRDRDIDTGARVIMLSEQGSTERLRVAWENEVNRTLERDGIDARVDRRSLDEQGIEREPQIHVGQAAQELTRRGVELESGEKEVSRLIDGERTTVTVNYPEIDQGKTRFEENEERKARNQAVEPELEWTDRFGMVAQQRSAMEWVKAAGERAGEIYEQSSRYADEDGDSGMAARMTREPMTDRKMEQEAREERREQTDRTAEMWDSRLSEFARAQMEATERQREQDQDRGMER